MCSVVQKKTQTQIVVRSSRGVSVEDSKIQSSASKVQLHAAFCELVNADDVITIDIQAFSPRGMQASEVPKSSKGMNPKLVLRDL